jgi:hypothetical protein
MSIAPSLKTLDSAYYDIEKEGILIRGEQVFLLVVHILNPHCIMHVEIWKVRPQS